MALAIHFSDLVHLLSIPLCQSRCVGREYQLRGNAPLLLAMPLVNTLAVRPFYGHVIVGIINNNYGCPYIHVG